jgi:type IV secretion system protein VirB9
MNTFRLTGLALIVAVASASVAESLPIPGTTDPRIQTATYRDDEVYSLTGTVGYQIDLVFDRDEHFVGLAAGDMDGVSFESQANHLFLKPKAAPVSTNLTILTDRRQYVVAYAVQPPSANTPAVYVLRFQYPAEQSIAAARARQAALAAAAIDHDLQMPRAILNTDYSFCGSRDLRPMRVTDDGVHTSFLFPGRAEVPAIFIRNDDGTESLANFSVTADAIRVHRIARQFILRRGKLVGCVVNRHFDGNGERLTTATVSERVTRTTPVVP